MHSGRVMKFLFLSLFFFGISYSQDSGNCSADYLRSLPVCSWSAPCESSKCFHGNLGIWGVVYDCIPGGYYNSGDGAGFSCSSFSPETPSDSSLSDIPDFEAVVNAIDVLVYVLIAVCLIVSFLSGFSIGSR